MDFYLSTVYIFDGENCKYTLILQIEECEREVVIMNKIDNVKTGVFTYKNKEYFFNYFTDIDISKKISFVNGVVDTIVTEKHYHPLSRGIVFGFQLINVFSDALSNFKDENGEDKEFSLVEAEDIIMNTKIVDIIMGNIKVGLIDELQDSIDKDIEYKTGIHRNPLGEAVASLLGTLEGRVKDINLSELMGFAKVFKDIPIEDMTPEKLWDAYAKSDAFKKVRAEINEKSQKENNNVIKITEAIEDVQKPKKRGRKPKAKKETVEQNDTK